MADKAAVLPFITQPQTDTIVLGSERTGTLEFPVYNDLTVTEAAWMAANGAQKSAFAYTSKCALKIAREENAKPIDTHAFVSKVLAAAMGATQMQWEEREQTWQVKYLRELEECAFKVLEVSVIEQQLLVTCMIRHRLPDMQHWIGEDTAKLPSELCEQIYEFALKEKNRGVSETVEDAVSEVNEMLGKSRTERIEAQITPTGEPSTTPAETSTPETPTSPETASARSPRRTSSKRSKKAPATDETTTTP